MSIFGPGIHDSLDKFFIEKVGGAGHRIPPIRSSAVSTFQTCPRKFLFDEKLGLKAKSYEGALFRGDIYHQFRAHLIQGVSIEEAVKSVRATLDESKTKLAQQAGTDGRLPGGYDLASILSTIDDDFGVAQAMAEAVHTLHPLDPKKWRIALHPITRSPMVETLHEQFYAWEGETYKIVVQFDRVLEHIPTGNIWLVDDKTTKFSPSLIAASKSFALQIRLYRTALCELFPPERIVGTIHTILKVPTIRQKQKQSFKEYVQEVKDWYPKKATENPDDKPIIQSFTRFDEDVWSAELHEIIQRQCIASGRPPVLSDFPRHDGACFKYDKTCAYLHLCNTNPGTWPRLIPLTLTIRFREDENKENANVECPSSNGPHSGGTGPANEAGSQAGTQLCTTNPGPSGTGEPPR